MIVLSESHSSHLPKFLFVVLPSIGQNIKYSIIEISSSKKLEIFSSIWFFFAVTNKHIPTHKVDTNYQWKQQISKSNDMEKKFKNVFVVNAVF